MLSRLSTARAIVVLVAALTSTPGILLATDLDRDGIDDGASAVQRDASDRDDALVSATSTATVATFMVGRTHPWVYSGLSNTRQWSPLVASIHRWTIDWYTNSSPPQATRILLFTYNGDIGNPGDDPDAVALYNWLTQQGYPVTVRPQNQITTLPVSYLQGFAFVIYWNGYGWAPARALESGVPFLTMSYMHCVDMGFGQPGTATSAWTTAECVEESFGPTRNLPVGPLAIGGPTSCRGFAPTAIARPLLKSDCGEFPAAFRIEHFVADPDTLLPSDVVTLSWEVTGDAEVSIDGFGVVGASGSLTTPPERSRSYTLRALGESVERRAFASVTVVGEGVQPGTLEISWARDAWPGTKPLLLPGMPFEFHVVAIDPPGGIAAYDFSVDLPPCFTVQQREFFPQPGAVDTGAGDDNYVVSTGGVCMAGSVVTLVSYRVTAFNASCLDLADDLDVGAPTPSDLVPPSPDYRDCGGSGIARRFLLGPPQPLQADPAEPPVVTWFEAVPPVLEYGQQGRLEWDTRNCLRVAIEPGGHAGLPATGSLPIDPTETTNYTLIASGPYETAWRGTRAVRIPFGIVRFAADRDTVQALDSITLSWEVAGAAEVSIDGFGPVPATGSLVTQPERSRTYELTASGGDYTRTALLQVTVRLDEVTPGLLALSWQPDQPPGAPPVLAPYQPFDFYVVALDPPGGAQKVEWSVVVPECLVIVERELVSPVTGMDIGAGADNWIVTTGGTCLTGPGITLVRYGAVAASAECLQPGVQLDLAGASPSAFVPATPGYQDCEPDGHLRRFALGAPLRLDPTGGVPEVVIRRFEAGRPSLLPGETGSLSWQTLYADEVQIEPEAPLGLPTSGSLEIDPPGTTTYTLTARNARGERSATVTVGRVPFVVRAFEAADYALAPGDSTLLTWQVDGVGEVSLDPHGPQPMVGSLLVRPAETTVYMLRVRNGEFASSRQLTVYVQVGPATSGWFSPSWSATGLPGMRPQLGPYQPFDFHVLAVGTDGGVFAYECSVTLPAGLIVAGPRELEPAGSAYNFATGEDNFVVGTGGVCVQGAVIPLIHYRGCLFLGPVPHGAAIAVGPATPSSFPETATPGFLTCAAGSELRAAQPGAPLGLIGAGGGEVLGIGVELTVHSVAGGLLLEWHAASPLAVQMVRVFRRQQGEVPYEIAQLIPVAGDLAQAWIDPQVTEGIAYAYSVLLQGESSSVASSEVHGIWTGSASEAPSQSQLLGAVPNPFNPRTEIRYALARQASPVVEIFNAAGQRVCAVRLGALPAGVHAWTWTGVDDDGQEVGSGVYHVRLQADGSVSTLRVTLLR